MEDLGEPVRIPDKPKSRLSANLADINELIRGRAAMEKLAEPTKLRGSDGREVQLNMVTVEELQHAVDQKNNIKVLLARALGYEVCADFVL